MAGGAVDDGSDASEVDFLSRVDGDVGKWDSDADELGDDDAAEDFYVFALGVGFAPVDDAARGLELFLGPCSDGELGEFFVLGCVHRLEHAAAGLVFVRDAFYFLQIEVFAEGKFVFHFGLGFRDIDVYESLLDLFDALCEKGDRSHERGLVHLLVLV